MANARDAMLSYPRRLPVLPAPEVVLFPHTHLPLEGPRNPPVRLDEPTLAPGARVVVATQRPGPALDEDGHPNVFRTACAGRIVRHERVRGDGPRLIVRGERAVRVREYVSRGPLLCASLYVSPPEESPVFASGGPERLSELRGLIERCCPGAWERLRPSLYGAPEADGGLELINTLAASFPVGVPRKLEWLAERTPRERWEAVLDTLRARCRERQRGSVALGRYSDLSPPDPQQN